MGMGTMTCESLFFDKQIQVDNFSVAVTEVSNSQAHSQKVDITLEASLVNADVSQTVVTSAVQRNWQ